jgi:hypothetical protein
VTSETGQTRLRLRLSIASVGTENVVRLVVRLVVLDNLRRHATRQRRLMSGLRRSFSDIGRIKARRAVHLQLPDMSDVTLRTWEITGAWEDERRRCAFLSAEQSRHSTALNSSRGRRRVGTGQAIYLSNLVALILAGFSLILRSPSHYILNHSSPFTWRNAERCNQLRSVNQEIST